MVPRRSRTAWLVRHARTLRGLLCAGSCAIGLVTAVARAAPERERTPHSTIAPNGALGAWLISGPCPDIGRVPATMRPGESALCEDQAWRVMANPSGDFDWAQVLNLPANSPAAAAAGLWLYLEKPFDGWLLVAADGTVRVSVDGRSIYRRDRPRQRGRGFVPIPLSLAPGFHPLWMGLERFGNRSTLSVLLRERHSNQAPADALIYLSRGGSAKRLVEQQLAISLSIPRRLPLELELKLAFPSGGVTGELPVRIQLRTAGGAVVGQWAPGTLDNGASLEPLVVHLGPLDKLAAEGESTLRIDVGGVQSNRKVWLTPAAVAALARASGAGETSKLAQSGTSKFDALAATLEGLWTAAAEQLVQPPPESPALAIQRLDRFATKLQHDENPLFESGLVDAFIRSDFDRRPVSALTYVPSMPRNAATPKPLVVLLHGYNSNSRRIMDAFLDPKNSARAAGTLDGFVLAPGAHGNTFYRGAGERNVLDALAWAMATYPIDAARVSITGVSMGGTGAAEIAFRHSELFAAAAPLCGYHSYFVRRDTANKPLRPWERRLMHRFSPASWAESGNDIPLFVAHGTKDLPLENSKSLTSRYGKLGYTLSQDWPDLGHAVWKKTYANGAMFSWLTQWRKDTDPARVVVASASLANGKKFWLEMTALSDIEQPSLLDAKVLAPDSVAIVTRGVTGFRLGPTRHLRADVPIEVDIDGNRLVAAVGAPREFARVDGHWARVAIEKGQATRLEGPWTELFASPFAVVYGTLDPTTAALNREIASRLVEPRFGVELHVPVIPDVEFSPETSPLKRILYVGRPDDHQHLAKLQRSLPIRITADAIELGTLRFTERDVGVALVYPDPNQRDRLVGVVSANGPEGLWRVLALPTLLPDFVVFDHGTDAAAGEPVLGPDAYLRAAGFFRSDWSLPDQLLDPLAPAPR